ncbi:MAG: hypothetical protein RIS35_2567 [Pseudomonadota bacterium]|jgi:2,3-dihydroxyphenylpropionate 1,2-dioxygenase
MTAERAFLGLSHTPLMGLNPVAPAVEAELSAALDAARDAVHAWRPDRVVLIGPDHYNGFFNELMPSFCIGTEATSVGDYTTPAGPLNVDAQTAEALAAHLMDAGFDPAVSRRMQVDHGFAQALQVLWGGLDTPPVIPIFMNAVAQPGIPRGRRCLQLGRAIGAFLDTVPGRTLLIGSGGLSHEPPVPTLSHPDPAVRERITVRSTPTQAERDAKTQRVMAAGRALAAGDPSMKPLAPEWDARWMDAIEDGRLDELARLDEAGITRDAGLSAHESKTWLIARAALPEGAPVARAARFYRAIPDYIAGFGVLALTAGTGSRTLPESTAFDRIIGTGRSPSAAATMLGWRLLEVDQQAGTIRVRFDAKPEFANPIGNVQGGILASMLDETMGPVSLTRLAPAEFAPTVEFKVGFVRPVPIGPVIGVARVVNAGRSLLFLEGQLQDERGRLVATATATAMRVAAPG